MKNFLFVLLALFLIAGLNACSKDSDTVTGTTGGGNHNPDEPFNPNPTNNATNVSRQNLTISWDCTDPDQGDTLRYDVVMGTSANPSTIISSDQLAKSYQIIILQANATFYWRIVAKDNHGSFTNGPVWKFTTGN